MSTPARLRNWSITGRDPFAAPELGSYLSGDVYDHPRFEDGHSVTTSRIESSKGREVKTLSRTYILEGPPDPEWVKFCEEQGSTIDPDDPIKWKD